MPFGIVAYAFMLFSWTTFLETAVNWVNSQGYWTWFEVHLNRYRNKLVALCCANWRRRKQSNRRESGPHGPARIVIRQVLWFLGQVVTQLITKSINAALVNGLKINQNMVTNNQRLFYLTHCLHYFFNVKRISPVATYFKRLFIRWTYRYTQDHRSPKRNIRVCMALEFDRKLNNNIPSKTYQNYNKVWECSLGVFCCVFFHGFSELPKAVYLSSSGPRAGLYYVNEKGGNLKSNLNCNLTRHLRRALRKPR